MTKANLIVFVASTLLILILPCCSDTSISETQVAYRRLLEPLSDGGYGRDNLSRDEGAHDPMAYSLIASAEAHRYAVTSDKEALATAMSYADWLVDKSDLNGNGLIGWGLPYAWDAFQDGSVNPAHTEYAITTALVVQGLLDTYDAIEAKRAALVTCPQ